MLKHDIIQPSNSPSVQQSMGFDPNGRSWLLVMPNSLRNEIIEASHDHPTAGHLGYSHTLARIREKYYWPPLPKSVRHNTQTCRECQIRKNPPTNPAGLLHPIKPPLTAFDQIAMDLLDPFRVPNSGNRSIVIAMDYLTRYAEYKALPLGTSAEIEKFFIESIVLRRGGSQNVNH